MAHRTVENAQSIVIPAIWPMVAVTTAFFGSRIYSRITRSGQTWWDDYILAIGWVFLIAAASSLTAAVRLGHLTSHPSDPLAISALVRITHTFHLLSLALSKTSFAVSLLRFSSKIERVLIWAVIASINALFIFHVIAQWKGVCGDTSPYKLPGSCWAVRNPGIINITSSMYSAITDFVLALLPWRVIWNLNMAKNERVSIGLAMSFGALAGAIGIMKSIQSFKTLDPLKPEFTWNLMLFWIFSLAEPCSTIIAASIPILRVLVRDAARSVGYGSNPHEAGYIRSEDNRYLNQPAHSRRSSVGQHPETFLEDTASERSILHNRTAHQNGGITLKTEVSVEFDKKPSPGKGGEAYEMRGGFHRSNSVKVKGKEEVVFSSPPM